MKPLAMQLSLGRGFSLSAWSALFVLTVRQFLRGRQLLVLSLLFLLPTILVILVRLSRHPPLGDELEFGPVFNLIPHVLVTLTTLLYAAGMVQDEVENQTLTYLLARPLPRWLLYVTKLAATFLLTVALTGAFTTLTLVAIYWDTAELSWDALALRTLKIVGLLALTQAAYCSLFGLLGMVTRRSLILGLAYIALGEGVLASIDFVLRQLTVNYYFRVLSIRWLDPEMAERRWSIDLETAPTIRECVLTLVCASAAFTLLGALLMMRREFRLKTPEGS